MSGIVSLSLGIVEYFRKQKTEGAILAIVASLFLMVSFDQAWQDEHRNSEVLIAEKRAVIADSGFWKQQYYGQNEDLRSRDALLAQNYSALIGEQSTANKTQDSIAQLSRRILEIGKPEPQKTTVIFFEKVPVPGDARSRESRYLLLTNKEVNQPSFDIACNRPPKLIGLNSLPHGEMDQIGTTITPIHFELRLRSPAWTPTYPLEFYAVYPDVNDDKLDVLCNVTLK